MAKTPKSERVRALNAKMVRIASAVIRVDRKIEEYMDRKATELEVFADQLTVMVEPEPENTAAN
jgi:hypothetical protein